MPLRCVIVDDSPALLDAARELLEGEGIAVVGVAATGAEALRLVPELAPDVVLIDIDLANESGFGLARRLQGSLSILISTHDAQDYAELIADSPAIGFVSKSDLSAASIHRVLDDGATGRRGT